MKKINRYLATYLNQRFKKSIKETSETELIRFLNDNGWILYDTETMIKDFLKWRSKEDRYNTNPEIMIFS